MSEAESKGVLDPLYDWVQQSDLRIVLSTVVSMYALFAVLVLLQTGFEIGAVNQIAGAWRSLTFFFAAYSVLTLALNLHWGYTGMFNIGVAGFMAVGVYTMALLSTSPDAISGQGLGLPLPIGVLGGMLAAAFVGLIAAVPALRLRADYLAIVTLGLSEIIRQLIQSKRFSDWMLDRFGFATGGGSGIDLPDRPTDALFDTSAGESFVELFIITWNGERVTLVADTILSGFAWSLVVLLFMSGIYWLLRRVGNSPFGRVLKAIREDELVAQSLGKDTRWFKIKVFMLGCALMGLGGILFQGSQGFVDPNAFRPLITFYVFVALIIGGSGSNTGSIVGSILFVGLLFLGPQRVGPILDTRLGLPDAPASFHEALGSLAAVEPMAFLAYIIGNFSPVRFVFVGIVLIIIIQKRPEGMLGHRTETAAAIDLSKPHGPPEVSDDE